MTQIDGDLYKDTQALINFWDTLAELMAAQKVDILELSYRTDLTERELEDYFHNYADVKLKTLLKLARALKLPAKIAVGDAQLSLQAE